MASRSKGGHVRGGVVVGSGGLLSLGALTLTLSNGVAVGLNVALANIGNLGGAYWMFQSVNGQPYQRFVTVQAPFVSLVNAAPDGSVFTGQTVNVYVEWRDAKAELVARSNFVVQVVP